MKNTNTHNTGKHVEKMTDEELLKEFFVNKVTQWEIGEEAVLDEDDLSMSIYNDLDEQNYKIACELRFRWKKDNEVWI